MPQIDVEAALAFIKWLGQAKPSIYTLPFEGGTPQLRLAKPSTLAGILEEYHNTYYSLALVKPGLSKKAGKDELVSTSFLHVDLDPRKGSSPADELTRLLDSVTDKRPKEIPAPSAIIASGRGIQALWRLADPIALPEGIEAVESANKWLLECLVGPPSTWNVDRILRLPGSWNCLDPKKAAEGFVPAKVGTVELNDKKYKLEDFGKYEPSQTNIPTASLGGSGPHNSDSVTAPVEYIEELDELDQYKLHARVKWLISQGHPGTNLREYEELYDKLDPKRNPNDRSSWVYDVNCNCLRAGVPDGKILGLLLDKKWGISSHCTDQTDPEFAARRQLARAKNTVAKDKPKELPPSDDSAGNDDSGGKKAKRKKKGDDDDDGPTPLELARWLYDERKRGLVRVNGQWMTQDHHAYRPLEDEAIRQEIYDKYKAFDSRGVSKVQDALRALHCVYRDKANFQSPCWLDGRAGPDPRSLIIVKNGMVDVATGQLQPYDNQLYTTCALDFDFDPNAAPPYAWLAFLQSIWAHDVASIEALQMWFGYCLTQDTSLQKMLNIIGPPRSGKGTIAYVLEELIGKSNCCGPNLNDLGGDGFGFEAWIGKQLAVIGDARIGKKTDPQIILERLLQVIGEDLLSVRRKGIANWEGRLNARVVLLSNAVLDLQDEAGALLPRLLVLATTESFIGREDTGLQARLKAELPCILKWALQGLQKLRQVGKITQPEAGKARLAETVEATTPLQHPWQDILGSLLGNKWGKLLVSDAWLLLGQNAARDQGSARKLNNAMKELGWKQSRQRKNGASHYCYLKPMSDEGMPFVEALSGRWVVAHQPKHSNRYIAVFEGEAAEQFEQEQVF